MDCFRVLPGVDGDKGKVVLTDGAFTAKVDTEGEAELYMEMHIDPLRESSAVLTEAAERDAFLKRADAFLDHVSLVRQAFLIGEYIGYKGHRDGTLGLKCAGTGFYPVAVRKTSKQAHDHEQQSRN